MSDPIETPVSRRLASVKNIIIVLSGKGGVGKSSSSVQLALSLLSLSPSNRVGLLDLDITGPSLPRMVGLDIPEATVHQSSAGWVPVYVDNQKRLGVMSIGFLLKDRGDSVVWRGPKKDGMIRQFLSEVRWGELDYLVIDTPPGTSDEHISLLTHLHPLFSPTPTRPTIPSSILISTPQTTALNDTLKSLSFTKKLQLPVNGLVENMSGYVCPCCNEISYTFGNNGNTERIFRDQNHLEVLGKVPIDTVLVGLLDSVSKGEMNVDVERTQKGIEGEKSNGVEGGSFPLLDEYSKTASSTIWRSISEKLVEKIGMRRKEIIEKLGSINQS
ncbi:cytosolic Fe-S cluster assembly factor CFD1 [Kwoniella bestiolae CBS 10118]|uniref:Cytosolic Fe-S cluster assembly factor CFD1 n=1 Tax=Kwoniella bestiolae CBS 10118 TaxID=1296100 RepID=A0AAJ8M9X7_9TREE